MESQLFTARVDAGKEEDLSDRKQERGGLVKVAKVLLAELESSRLEVVLIPSRDPDCAMRGGMLRAVQEQNADWYQSFARQFESHRKDRLRWRKFKTKIKRNDTLRGLRELVEGNCDSVYAQRLKDFIEHGEPNGKH